jgi:hypothetical protein
MVKILKGTKILRNDESRKPRLTLFSIALPPLLTCRTMKRVYMKALAKRAVKNGSYEVYFLKAFSKKIS